VIAFLLALSLRASMRPSFSSVASIALVVFAPLASLASCQLIAGIDEKTYAGVGGGATATSSVAGGGMGTGGVSAPQVGDPLCAPGTLDNQMCPDTGCTQGSQDNGCDCGECGHHCLDQLCKSGYCEAAPIAIAQPFVYRVATNGLRLFIPSFTEVNGLPTTAQIFGVPLDSLTSVNLGISLVATELNVRIKSVAADCNKLYYVTEPQSGLMAVKSIAIDNMDPASSTLIDGNDSDIADIVADEQYVFWVNADGGGGNGSVKRWDKSSVKIVASQQHSPVGLALDEDYVYWSYGANDTTGGIRRAKKISPSQQDTILMSLDHPRAIAVDDTHVYWLEQGKVLKRVFKDGSVEEVLHGGMSTVGDVLAVDETHIYWIELGNLYKMPKDNPSATPTPIAGPKTGVGTLDVSWFALDRARAYFTHTDVVNSTVMWVAK